MGAQFTNKNVPRFKKFTPQPSKVWNSPSTHLTSLRTSSPPTYSLLHSLCTCTLSASWVWSKTRPLKCFHWVGCTSHLTPDSYYVWLVIALAAGVALVDKLKGREVGAKKRNADRAWQIITGMTRQLSFKVWFGVGLKKKNTSHDTQKKSTYIIQWQCLNP